MNLNLEAADAYCRMLTHRHYENFSVASRFVDSEKRLDLMRIYAFCRTTDDLGDESSDGNALARLERWRAEVEALFAGEEPVHPVLFALQQTIARRAMPKEPFLNLIEANVQDQIVKRYRTWDELIGYCNLSAAPVGRMVLCVFGVNDARSEQLSDDVCIGLQLANHAQDVSRDAAIGRRYLVEGDVEARGIAGAAQVMVERARALLGSGEALEARVPRALRLQLTLYRTGGLAICDAIAAIGYKTEHERPSVSTRTKVLLVVRAALQTFSRGRPA
ncbi:MAG: squalene/phytoene synthase family protein [Candidatus Cybelea sp.]